MDSLGNVYNGRWVPHLTKAQIQSMKKNMKKVPIIKTKSDKYHSYEEQEAEKLLEKNLGEEKK